MIPINKKMVWPSEVKTLQLSVYRSSSDMTKIAQKFGEDQTGLIGIRSSFEKLGDEEVVTKLLMKCGTVEKCRAFAECIDKHYGDPAVAETTEEAAAYPKFLEQGSGSQLNAVEKVVPIDTVGDGACFFRAVGYWLLKDKNFTKSNSDVIMYYLQIIRNRVVKKVIEMWDQPISDGLPMSMLVQMEHEKNTPEEYETYMSDPLSWAGSPEVLAAAEAYEGLIVYQNSVKRKRSGGNDRFTKHTFGGHEQPKVRVFYNGKTHYSALEH